MGHLPLLDELAVVAAIGVLVTLVLARLGLPAVAGLLLAGVIAGPRGLAAVTSLDTIEVLAELGVVLLLFTIGLEFSLARLGAIFRQVAVGGLLQVALTTLLVLGTAVGLGFTAKQGLFFGFVVALSSTAIVLRALGERRELDAPHGRFIVGTLIFQDLCVVPMVLVVPLLGKDAGAALGTALARALLEAGAVVVVTIALARVVVPRVFRWVDSAKSREIFLLAVLGVCLGTAWLTSVAGLSLALGAFLGGMLIADTEFGHRALSDVLPLRDAFVSIFFVSLGMLFDVRTVAAQPGVVLLLTAGFVFGKGAVATLSAMVMRFPSRVAWLAGVGLAQFGEFGFVLARLGEDAGVVEKGSLDPLLAAGILSMFFTPLLVRLAPHVTAGERLLGPLEKLIGVRGIDQASAAEVDLGKRGHVVLVGYGVAGQLLARTLAASKVPFVVLELNAETVRAARARGEAVFYADATSAEALGHAHLETARALVLVMNDPSAAQRVLATAKRLAPNVPVFLRTKYVADRDGLTALGASEVVAEEVEGALEMITRLLATLAVPRNHVEARLREVRAHTRTTQRKLTVPRKTFGELEALADLKLERFVVDPGAQAVGQSPKSLDLRNQTGALVVAVQRKGALQEQPDAAALFEPGDIVFLAGSGEAMRKATPLFSFAPAAGA